MVFIDWGQRLLLVGTEDEIEPGFPGLTAVGCGHADFTDASIDRLPCAANQRFGGMVNAA